MLSASRDFSTIRVATSASFSAESRGSPHTCSTLTPLTTRLTPAASGMVGMALMRAVVIPAFSSSLEIVAPQRLQLPQVATSKAAVTPLDANSPAISAPMRLALVTEVPLPTVEKKTGWSDFIRAVSSNFLKAGNGST